MSVKTHTGRRSAQAAGRPLAKAPTRAAPHAHAPVSTRPSRARMVENSARHPPRKPIQQPRRTQRYKRDDSSREWIKAGLMLAGFVAVVILAIHFIGGSGAPSSSSNNNNQASGNPSSSTPVINSGSGSSPALATTAQALGITTDTLKADLQSGETVAQIAQAQDIPIATVNTAYLNGVQQLCDQMVQGGNVSQATADQLYQQEQQKVQSGQYDMLGSSGSHVIVSNGQVTTGG